MRGKRIVSIALIMSIVCNTVSGCGLLGDTDETEVKLAQLQQQANTAQSEANGYKEQLDKYKQLLIAYGITSELSEEDLKTYTVLSNGNIDAYKSFNDHIALKSKLEIEATSQLENKCKISLYDNVFVSPTEKWRLELSTSRTDMYYGDSIWGYISVCGYYPVGVVHRDQLYDMYIKDYLDDIGCKNKASSVIYWGGAAAGCNSTSTLTIEKEVETKLSEDEVKSLKEQRLQEMQAKYPGVYDNTTADEMEVETVRNIVKNVDNTVYCGVLYANNTMVQYMFMHEQSDTNKILDDVIEVLISSIQFGEQKISFQTAK